MSGARLVTLAELAREALQGVFSSVTELDVEDVKIDWVTDKDEFKLTAALRGAAIKPQQEGGGGGITVDLKELRAALLEQEIRQTRAEADMAELDLIVKRELEADRLAKPGYNRSLYINTPIFGEYTDDYIGALEHWGRREQDNERPITITISSPGGSVMDGLALYDTIQRLRRKGVKIVTRASGLVASMATIILQAGDERVADQNVQILVHELSSTTGGKISGIKDEAAMMERLNDRLLSILAERSTLSKRQILNKSSRKEWWLDADEALKLGFVDRVE